MVLATDYAVPLERNREILAIYRSVLTKNFGDKFAMFGHIGDAHVHTEVLPETHQEWERSTEIAIDLAKEVVAMGGTVGAEHGLGKRKAHLLSIQYGTGRHRGHAVGQAPLRPARVARTRESLRMRFHKCIARYNFTGSSMEELIKKLQEEIAALENEFRIELPRKS